MLDPSDARHLWLLHFLFLDQLNIDCEQFQNDWNHHSVSKRGHDQSPLDMRFLSQIQHGEYADCHEQHPHDPADAEIMAGQQRFVTPFIWAQQTMTELPKLTRHVRNTAVGVPPTANPFQSIEAYQAFTLAFQQARHQGDIPTGYGVAQEEWVDGVYPEREVITVGRSKRVHEMGMPFVVWWPRAILDVAVALFPAFLHPTSLTLCMSADVPSSITLSCPRFVPGGGRKGNRCKMCQRKERHHSNVAHSTNPAQQHAASCPPSPDNPIQTILDQYTRTRPKAIPQPRHEAVTGLRKMPPRAAKRGTRGFTGTGGVSVDSSRGLSQERAIKIGRLMMTPHGLTAVRAGRLSICKVPRKSEFEEYRQHGLLVSEDGEQDIEFLVSWSMNDIDSWLRRLLPKPFEWLDARLGKPAEGSFHWALLNSERQKYFVLMRPMITGKELNEVKGSAGRKFTTFSVVIAPRINIPRSIYTDWDHAISQALNGSVPMDGASNMDAESDSEIADDSDNALVRPPSKGKARAHPQSVLELTTDSDGSDSNAVQIIGTQPINYARSKSTTSQPSVITTTSHEVAPSQSNMPRAMAHLFVPSATIPDSESDDDFFFTKLIARESEAAASGSKHPRRRVSLSDSELAACESQPSAGKRIKLENYHTTTTRGLGARNEPSDEVAEAGPSGSGMTTGLFTTRRSTAVRPPDSPSCDPWK
ncbi:hypothetical protein JVT61DRAFT_4997 [Boletus reticuloceps]|uniref:Integrase core domain-containing protein n=1 Tax=Boletus reticuloceps TaxID=495285 RepID=A0A8I3AFN1_9AGAM|nr:hypothetical protein JVT61DRAFT_4997 [Boletus reticuloceps]